ncbi:hypothetical protein LY78DRAFT_686953 [Colletotrichum sublineola]|nr:hypothetical protein LY78DRAFT_686953 [Colletotrichum sublineola]
MPTYAIIRATGNYGTALIEQLSQDPAAHIHAFCRDGKNIHDVNLLAQCIQDTQAVFHVVSTNTNVPGCHIGLNIAKSIVAALENIKALCRSPNEKQRDKLPKIILLSSATIDDKLSEHSPAWLHAVLLRSASHVYEDLRQTEAFLRAQGDSITTVFIKPGGLSVNKQ